ncbi:MAG: hypothetical protein ACE37F_33695 [Nannocystaceae bacterium]|nr:hypothetical protein [bacterium]
MMRATVLTLSVSLLALGGCDQVKKIEGESETGSGDAVPEPVQQVLDENCATPGCHVSGATAPDLSEASGGAWLSQAGAGGPYVVFGNVEGSYLVEKTFPNPASGGQMPPGGMLAPEDQALLVGWVAGVEFPDADSGGSDTDATDTDDPTAASDTDDTGSDLVLCSIEVVAPDITSPVVSGDGAGVIPSSIGGALERNCGCHYTDQTSDPTLYFPYNGGTQLRTLQNFTDNYAGANSTYAGSPAWEAVQDRVIVQQNMPTAVCEVEGGGAITAEDFALFEAWFEQGAPDGASFTPPA